MCRDSLLLIKNTRLKIRLPGTVTLVSHVLEAALAKKGNDQLENMESMKFREV